MFNGGKRFHLPLSDNGSTNSYTDKLKPTKQALAYVEKTSSLGFIEYMFFRAIKEGGETGQSLESLDLSYLMKVNEYLDIQAYLEDDVEKQQERKNKTTK